jgi:hypothetical protein
MPKNEDSWMVWVDGEERGPANDATIVEAIQGGLSPATKIRRTHSRDWTSISAHPTFAFAFHRAGVAVDPSTARAGVPPKQVPAASAPNPQPTLPPIGRRTRSSPWPSVTGIASILCALLLVAVLVFSILTRKSSADSLTVQREQLAATDRLTSAVREASAADHVDLKNVEHRCSATNPGMTCYFTNLTSKAVEVCARGTILPKEDKTTRLESLVVCSGRIRPNETNSSFGPWKGGIAEDLCSTRSRWGNTHLDWDKCDFEVDTVKPVAK